MSTIGITAEGLVIKRLAEIKTEWESSLRDAYGENINLLPESTLGQLVGIASDRESKIWELVECLYNSQYPSTAEGVQLDKVVSISGLLRLESTKSSVDLLFSGTPGTTIPKDFIVSQVGNEDNKFLTSQAATIAAGQNEIQSISFDLAPDLGDFTLSINGETTTTLSNTSNSGDVELALNNLPSLSSVLVTGDFLLGFTIEFTGTDGLLEQPEITVGSSTLTSGGTSVQINVTEQQKGSPNQISVPALNQVTGSISAPANTLQTQDSPLTGIDSVTNPLDAVLGRDEEEDSELKLRRDASLQRAGAGTVSSIESRLRDLEGVIAAFVTENVNNIPDIDGRPAHSYEAIVQGGDMDEICDTIWTTKPGGIETVGNQTCTIVDSQGFTRIVKFSRPTEVPVYIEVDLTTGSEFPADGVQKIRDAIIAWGESLSIGSDVIVFPKLISQICVAAGVLDVAIRIGISPSPTLDDNIIIAANEVSAWDTSRTTVNII